MARGARPDPIQAIVGEDSWLAERALEGVLDQALGADRDDALQVVYGDESRWSDVLARARTGSLFASHRVIVVRRADQLKGDEPRKTEESSKGAGAERGEPDPVAAYLEDPSPDVTLVLLAPRPDRRRAVWKKVLAAATVHSADPKKGRALRTYVEGELRRRGLRLAPEGVEELIDRVGQDLRRLMGEVEKLEAFAAGHGQLSGEDVAAVLGRGFAPPLYRLADAVAERQLGRSLALVDELMREGEEGLKILATLHRSLRQVRAAAALKGEGRAGEVGRRLLPANMQFKAKMLLDAARRWDEPQLRRAFAALARADRRMKEGTEAETTLAAAVVEACGGGGGFRPSPRRGR